MKGLARAYVWWPGINKHIGDVTKNCSGCQKIQNTPPQALLHPWEWPSSPWQRVHIDFAEPFMDSIFLIAVDAHSKWPEVIKVKTNTSEKTITVLRTMFVRNGIAQQICTDNGRQFVSEEFQSFVKSNGIKHFTSAPYHPSTSGLAERIVQTFKKTLKARDSENRPLQHKINSFLAYCNAVHATTNQTPAMMFLNRNLRSRMDLLKPNVRCDVENRQLKHSNAKSTWSFNVGQSVLARDYRTERRQPGIISTIDGPLKYRVQAGENVWRRHVDQILNAQVENTTTSCPDSLDIEANTPDVTTSSLPTDKPVISAEDPPDVPVETNFPSQTLQGRHYPERQRRPPPPRLPLYYDILEDRVPADLIAEYNRLLSKCEEIYKEFIKVRNNISTSDSESELSNVSMVEGVKLCEELDKLKYKLRIMESPLYRYVLRQEGYGLPGKQAKGIRSSGEKVIHVVSSSMTINLLQSLLKEKLNPDSFIQEQPMEFHSDPLAAINGCYEGDVVIICPGRYSVNGYFRIADSIQVEGYGLPDDIVLVKEGKGDTFIDCTATCVKISNLKLIQYDATEGILCVRKGQTILEGCVLQSDCTGVVLKTGAELHMKNCDLYGAKGAGIEIYPSSTCELFGNDIHHCKEGILVKNFMEQLYDMPKITMMNNLIHNHEGYGITMSKFAINFTKMKPFFVQQLTSDTEVKKNLQNDFNEQNLELNSGCGITQHVPDLLIDDCSPTACEEIVVLYPTDAAECDEAITNELISTSATKREQSRSRLNETVDSEMNNLISQEIFPSIVGNHFKKNGKGSFGIVYC
ncbi:SHC SH2 domain-binding protein 1 isoform X1 [Mobula birostris]|uniref:SHC SH2 domain-binding protein 1 isoform X1 n=1 Tax=Mobula birostris TaxID=1983395 RepID=UPI003B28AE68